MARSVDEAAIRAESERLGVATSDLAEVLYDLDADPAVRMLTAASSYEGATAAEITQAIDDFEDLWPGWASLRDAVDQLSTLVDDGQIDGARALLADQQAVTIPDRPQMPIATAAAWLVETADITRAIAARLADAAVTLTPRIDAARARLGRVDEEAAGLDATTDETLVAARQALADAGTRALRDPLGCDPTTAEEAVAAAEARIAELTSRRDRLAAALGDARRLVSELTVLIPQGRDALAHTRDRIAAPQGLLQPMDPAVVEATPLGLRPWLGRIADAAARGDWQSAAAGLERWHKVADVHLANAQRIAARNAAPVERRDELRGLLEALRAKAGAVGLAEDPTATELHEAARALLWVAPCPLDEAAERVEAYRRAVANGSAS